MRYEYVGSLRIGSKRVEEFVANKGFVLHHRKTIMKYLREHGPVTKSKMLKHFQNVMQVDKIDAVLAGLEQDGFAESSTLRTRTKPTTIWRAIGEPADPQAD